MHASFSAGRMDQGRDFIASRDRSFRPVNATIGPDGNLYIGRKALRDALYATKNLQGLTGNISCDEYGDCADPKIAIYKTAENNVKELTMPDKPFWKPY